MVRHYTPQVPSAVSGHWPPQDMGFDLADVSSPSKMAGMPEGVDGLVYLGQKNGVDQLFKDMVGNWRNNPRVWGYYIVDEPFGVSAASIKAQADYIHEHHPGAIAYAKLTNQTDTSRPRWDPYNIETTGCDILGIGGYSVRSRFPGGYDPELIERYVTTAVRDGIPIELISPYMQTFGGVIDWPLPTEQQMEEMFADWRRLCPKPIFDCCYAWSIQPQWGTQGLANNEMMRAATLRHFKLQEEGEPEEPGDTPVITVSSDVPIRLKIGDNITVV